MASPPKRKPTKVPLLPGTSLGEYVAALHPSLFTNPSYFTPEVTGLDSEEPPTVEGVIIGTAREMFLAVVIHCSGVGGVNADAATFPVPLKRAASAILSVTWLGPPTVDMPPATIDEDGLVALPPFAVDGGDILITGTILEA